MSDAAALRHDLKNVLTALESGCMLVGARVRDDAEAQELLDEMRAELRKGKALVDRWRELEHVPRG